MPAIPQLTTIRFAAALLVVLFHVGDPLEAELPRWVGGVFDNGYAAVGFFFVLSGFILAYNYTPGGSLRVPARTFWSARAARLLPLYLLTLAVATPALLIKAFNVEGGLTLLMPTLLFVPLMLQAWVPPLAVAWVGPAWSLSAEAFFCTVFPALTRGIRRLRGDGLLLAVGLLWLVSLSLPTLYLAIAPDGLGSVGSEDRGFWLDALRWNPLVRLPDFAIGVLLGRYFLLERSTAGVPAAARRRARWLTPLAVVATIFAILLSSQLPHLYLHNGLLTPLYALLIYALAWDTGRIARALSFPLGERLGDASYALYLLHVPLWLLVRSVGVGFGVDMGTSAFWVVVFVVFAIACSLWAARLDTLLRSPLRARLERHAPRWGISGRRARSNTAITH